MIRLTNVEKTIKQKNKKIILKGRSNFTFKIFNFKIVIPKMANNKKFKFTIKLPQTILIGKKAKIIFINKFGLLFIKLISIYFFGNINLSLYTLFF